MLRILLLAFLVLTIAAVSAAQQTSKPVGGKSGILNEFDPNSHQPYGRLNPAAPKETSQFSFMVGVFDCVDQLPDAKTGKMVESKVVWSSKYFLNGFGVQDIFRSPTTVAMGTRIFDSKKGKWIVHYFQSQPRYFTGVWEGMKEGDDMIMRLKGPNGENRLTFSEIKKDGFEWIGELVTKDKTTAFWKISCKRRQQ